MEGARVSRASRDRGRADLDRYDRSEKELLYGIAEIAAYRIVDLVNGLIEVRRDRGAWGSISTFRRGETIAMLAFLDVIVDVATVLPPI